MDTNKESNTNDAPMQQEGYDLMAAAFEVYNELGCGFLEEVYQQSLAKELMLRNLPFCNKKKLAIYYKGEVLDKQYVPDMHVFDGIIAELKTVRKLLPEHEAQLINYLKATRMRVGYLINFGSPKELEWKRMVL